MTSTVEMKALSSLPTSATYDRKTRHDCDHVEVTHTPSSEDPQIANPNIKLSLQAQELHYTKDEAKKVKRKTDLIVLPLLCGCYFFSVSCHIDPFLKEMMHEESN